ncbi:Ubiquitin-associated domain-containing protein 1 [Cryptotermes secundus]|uniref:Ubiquitin-associated domain-containing protein 1 n=1 Tax=Cryptotermes secundus TaxID=105785 RepID=A0A2J7R702_9NEOP|nr:ubiquitin-associated domain-containing protein 1 isoform X2 [Cryptotermes secundus]PNF36614.1 Ubiquitin-associated domain-containing protein 1 [Cryptotermes secundus]
MFVSDTDIFSNSLVKLSVISAEGGVWNIDAAPDITVEKLKIMALCHFYSPLEYVKVTSNHKLVLVSEKRPLDNNNSVLQEGLRNNDELLLVECRQPPSEEHFTEDNVRGPTANEIRVATKDVEERKPLKLLPQEFTADFQSEIRKILISLVEASARIIGPSPNADEVFEVIQERLDAKAKTQPHSRAVSPFMDMGFSEHVASRALRLNRMNPNKALEWLLENGAEKEPEEDAVDHKDEVSSGAADLQWQQEPACTSSQSEVKKSQSVTTLLESFREFKRRDFQPNVKALQNLMDMGFPEEDVCDALCVTGNNQSAACEWLLGERRKSLEGLDIGLDPEGSIYKAIMSNPVIQLSLTSPKMLLAFLSLLENPSSANIWMNDPDASPVLTQIFKIYQAEKHALQTNHDMEQQQLQSTGRL